MSASTRTVALRELLEVYIASLSAQVHPVMTDHVQKTLVAFETALRVTVPRDRSHVPHDQDVLFILFQGTVDSLLAVRAPLSGVLEGGLLVRKLDEAGALGKAALDGLNATAASARGLREAHFTIL